MCVPAAKHVASVGVANGNVVQDMVGKEIRLAEVWLNCHEGPSLFQGLWSLRTEALLRSVPNRIADAKHHWIIACDANVDPCELVEGDCVREAPPP